MKHHLQGQWEGIDDNELFQAVLDSAPNGIAVLQAATDEQGRTFDFTVLLFNQYTLRWIGDIDYKGKLFADLFPVVKPAGILEKFIRVAESGLADRFDTSFDENGIHYWFRFHAVKKGNLIVVTTEDVTEHKLAEITLSRASEHTEKQKRLYDSITSTIPDLLYVFNLDYQFTYANKALLEMWGKRAEDAIGKGLRDNGYEEWHAQMHEREIDEVATTKKPIRGTVSFPHAEQGVRVYDYIFVPVINESGLVEAVAGSTRDITELKRAEERLQESEHHFKLLSATLEQQVNERTKELQRSNSDLQKFAHVASHDLKEPLRKVKTFLSRLEYQLQEQLDEVSQGYLDRIHASTNRMFTMIDGVLNYSTLNATQQAPEIVDISEVIRTIESDLEIALSDKNGVIEYDELPRLYGIPVLLYQLFYNLVNNSLKFTRPGVPPRVRISFTTETDGMQRYACIAVQDNGIGFEPKETAKIFETFTRLNSKDEYEGTGLGLSLCKKIAERHGGTINAHGSLNKGASFEIRLPMWG